MSGGRPALSEKGLWFEGREKVWIVEKKSSAAIGAEKDIIG